MTEFTDLTQSQGNLPADEQARIAVNLTDLEATGPLSIGKTIATERRRLRLSGSELARRARILPSLVLRIEQDDFEPDILMLWRIASALKMTLHDLLSRCEFGHEAGAAGGASTERAIPAA